MKEEFETPSAVELPKCTAPCNPPLKEIAVVKEKEDEAIPSSTWCAIMFSNPQVRPPPKLRPL